MALTVEQKRQAHNAKMRRLRAANPEHYREIRKRYYERHKERLALERRSKPGYREYVKRQNRKHALAEYGVSVEQYEEMFNRQHGLCAICREPETRIIRGFPASLSVDHDHSSGKARGLLCSKCNVGIGMFRTDPELLGEAILYLRRHGL